MLAYAGQGLASDSGSAKGRQVREFLGKAEAALGASPPSSTSFAKHDTRWPAPYTAFMAVIESDAAAAQAAVASGPGAGVDQLAS